MLELLLALGLMALLAGLVVLNTESIFRGLGERPLPDTLKLAVREARYQAAAGKDAVFLGFDAETASFVIVNQQGGSIAQLRTGYSPRDPELKVTFFKLLAARGSDIPDTSRPERREADWIAFHPDRSSTPFEVRLDWDGTTSSHTYDLFSDTEIETE